MEHNIRLLTNGLRTISTLNWSGDFLDSLSIPEADVAVIVNSLSPYIYIQPTSTICRKLFRYSHAFHVQIGSR